MSDVNQNRFPAGDYATSTSFAKTVSRDVFPTIYQWLREATPAEVYDQFIQKMGKEYPVELGSAKWGSWVTALAIAWELRNNPEFRRRIIGG